ncbi:Leukocyte receptor cluster (LRC) member 8 [Lignoscripta atroalba]|nr:Leukocyte receptor cluster (LRC) member 8 [Lignoscripta atroalba]
MTTSGAFTAVSARRTFVRPPPPELYQVPPPPLQTAPVVSNTTKSEKPKREWPLAVRQYVQRSFAAENSVAGIGREEMETKLKQVISVAAESNTLLTQNWDSLPLPQQMIQDERAKALQTPANMPWRDQFSTLNVQETNGFSNGTFSKKRKSSDLDPGQIEHDNHVPWRDTNNRNVFEDRLSYADKRQRNDLAGKGSSKFQSNLDTRKRRFEGAQPAFPSPQPFTPPKDDSPMPNVDQGPVIGRSQELEKKYFRLTSAPNPDTVRPIPVLEKTLEHLKKKWKRESNYSYICDQFKSLRQDLTVQHIKNDFTVNVYEIHARIALEKGDLGEYNQCQTQLRTLYSQNLGGHPTEFKAYRILYFIHTCNRTDMNDVLADLTPAEKQEPAVKHALEARSALALGNYHKFFRLYLDTPNMGAYLMDMFVARERLAALANMSKAYKPEVSLRFVTEELGFESDEECAQFLCNNGAQAFLDQRDGDVHLLTGKVGNTFEVAKNAAFRRVDIKGQI